MVFKKGSDRKKKRVLRRIRSHGGNIQTPKGSTPAVRPTMLQAATCGASSPPLSLSKSPTNKILLSQLAEGGVTVRHNSPPYVCSSFTPFLPSVNNQPLTGTQLSDIYSWCTIAPEKCVRFWKVTELWPLEEKVTIIDNKIDNKRNKITNQHSTWYI